MYERFSDVTQKWIVYVLFINIQTTPSYWLAPTVFENLIVTGLEHFPHKNNLLMRSEIS